jgi:hypothetical protein
MMPGFNNFLPTRTDLNDSIACHLLRRIDKYEQFAIMYDQEDTLLRSIFDTALAGEDYEICQVIAELLEERRGSWALRKTDY